MNENLACCRSQISPRLLDMPGTVMGPGFSTMVLGVAQTQKRFSQLMFPPNVGHQIDDKNRMSHGTPLSPLCESCQCVNSNLIREMGIKWARSRIGCQWHGMMGAVPIILGNYCLLPGYLTWSLWRAKTDTAYIPAPCHTFILVSCFY